MVPSPPCRFESNGVLVYHELLGEDSAEVTSDGHARSSKDDRTVNGLMTPTFLLSRAEPCDQVNIMACGGLSARAPLIRLSTVACDTLTGIQIN